MPTERSPSKTQSRSSFTPKDARPKPLQGTFVLILMLLLAVALADYRTSQNPAFSTEHTEANMIGMAGMYTAYWSIILFGGASWLLPGCLTWLSYMYYASKAHLLQGAKWSALAIITTCSAVLAALIQDSLLQGKAPAADPNYYPHGFGGWWGSLLYDDAFHHAIGLHGSWIVFGLGLLGAVGWLLHDNLLVDLKLKLVAKAQEFAKRRASSAAAKAVEKPEAKPLPKATVIKAAPPPQLAKVDKPAEPKVLPKLTLPGGKVPPSQASKPLDELPELPSKTAAVNAPPPPGIGGRPPREPVKPKPPFDPIVDTPPEADLIDALPELDESPVPGRGGSRPPMPPPAATRGLPAMELSPMESPPPAGTRPGLSTSLPSHPTNPLGELKIIASETTRKAHLPQPDKRGDYQFPPMKLLAEPTGQDAGDDPAIHQQTAEQLMRVLDEFGVKVTMGEVHAGPVITRYDVHPAPGVRVEKIVSLDKNLALGLKALSVRILAPVPGKGCVGIEVPNKRPAAVFIRDILESEDWVNTKAEIPIALGKEVSGKPLVADLTRMPHLLIAGSTGSGKTVCINTIITSLLYKASPDDIRFVMVDPKIVEMQVYNSLPHMLIPVVTDPKKVPNALKYLLNEMERRYQMFARVGVRNIAGFNAKMAKNKAEAGEAEARARELDAEMTPEERAAAANIQVPRQADLFDQLPEKLPYIVCIVDELADLMMVAPADIETGIARLAQLARAAGIHLILATQRPSVNVITGVIKANLPSRIAFKVASKVDSRTILDTGGADQLIGKGDMLFLPPGSADLMRSQGAFVSDDEINGIVEHIRDHNEAPEFDVKFQQSVEADPDGEEAEGGEEDDEAWDDNLVPQAIAVLKATKRASTSMLQRRLKIGYNRAARIMEILESEGIVGPENGSSPREILKDLDEL